MSNRAAQVVLGQLHKWFAPLQELPDQELLQRFVSLLCHLEGRTQEEAARQLGWTAATLKGRLDRGREVLRRRLTRRGLSLGSTLLATILTPATAPAFRASALVTTAMAHISGKPVGVSAQVVALVSKEVNALVIGKVKIMAAWALLAGVFAGGAGLTAHYVTAKQQPFGQKQEPTVARVKDPKDDKGGAQQPTRVDLYGDPLPPGAIARIGTTRFWPDDSDHGVVRAMAYTPDGKHLVSFAGKAVCFLDVTSGKELHRLEVPGCRLHNFALAPDGKTMATLGWYDTANTSEFCLWDAVSLKKLRRIAVVNEKDNSDAMYFVAFAPSGRTVAVGTSAGIIRLWDMASWREQPALAVGKNYFRHFLRDDNVLISVSRDHISWWNIHETKEIRRLDKIHPNNPRELALSANGKWLAILDTTNVLRLLNAATGEETWRKQFPAVFRKNEVRFTFTADGQELVYSSGDMFKTEEFETVFVATDTRRELRRWGKGIRWFSLAFAPDGKSMAHEANSYIGITNTVTGEAAVQSPRLPGRILSVQLKLNPDSLIACLREGQVSSWSPRTGKQLAPYQLPPNDIGKPSLTNGLATSFTADGTLAARVDKNGDLYVWQPATGKTVLRAKDQSFDGAHAVFSPTGKHFVVNDKGYGLSLWDVTRAELVRALPETGITQCRAFSPDGRVLATAAKDRKSLPLWETTTGKQVRQLFWKDGLPVVQVAFSPDGRLLVSFHGETGPDVPRPWGGGMRVWEWATGRELRYFPLPFFMGAYAPVISPDGKVVATAMGDAVRLWELATGKERVRFEGHRSSVYALSFSRDGRLLASGGNDCTALVWDVTGSAGGKLSLRTRHSEELSRLWSELGDMDAGKAHRAMWMMVSAQQQSVPFVAERVRSVEGVSGERIARLIKELDSQTFKVRSGATKELEQLGELAEPALSRVLASSPSLEMRRRVEMLLDKLYAKPLSRQQVHELRALEVLENAGTPQARQVLERLAKGAPGAWLTKEAKAAVDRLIKRATTDGSGITKASTASLL